MSFEFHYPDLHQDFVIMMLQTAVYYVAVDLFFQASQVRSKKNEEQR